MRASILKDPKAVTPILTTQQTDGSTGYYSIGLALKSLGHHRHQVDAKGKKLGYADPDSTSGYLIPLTQIPEDHRRAERELLRLDPVQRRPREQRSGRA